jgi:Nucleotidyl transferase AbiEii toxin, Type IV TA system
VRLDADLVVLDLRWALVGGLAVSVRAEPRTTWDVDIVVAVASDRAADRVVFALRQRGYRDRSSGAVLEQEAVGRLAGVRLLAPDEPDEGLGIDLLFNSSGVEGEIAAAADLIEIFPGVLVPVARLGQLLALKVLAGRPRDQEDCRVLLAHASETDLDEARGTLDLIERRGFHRGKDLQAELARICGSR